MVGLTKDNKVSELITSQNH